MLCAISVKLYQTHINIRICTLLTRNEQLIDLSHGCENINSFDVPFSSLSVIINF